MTTLDEALYSRRSERMLQKFGLDLMVVEPIYRERMPSDDRDAHFTPIEREGLMVMSELLKEVQP